MAVATLKEATKKLGISLDDKVYFYTKGNKKIIEAEFKVEKKKHDKNSAKDVFSDILAMSRDVGIKDWAENIDHYLYGTPKRSEE